MHTEGRSSVPSIILENLTARYHRPCILDLKMGTRTYKDDASPAKIASAVAKANITTTSSVGIRVCGMQLFDPAHDTYIREDKYIGRKFAPSDISATLRRFLDCKFTSDLIEVWWNRGLFSILTPSLAHPGLSAGAVPCDRDDAGSAVLLKLAAADP